MPGVILQPEIKYKGMKSPGEKVSITRLFESVKQLQDNKNQWKR